MRLPQLGAQASALGALVLFAWADSSFATAEIKPSLEVKTPTEFRVTLLGTGNPRPSLERFGPSTLVEAGSYRFLVDTGRGATQRLFQIGGGPLLRSVDRVFLTHLHSDHVVGLSDLWLSGRVFGRSRALQVLGPAGTHDLGTHLAKAYSFDVRLRREDEGLPEEGGRLEAQDVRPGVVFRGEGLQVTAFLVDHGGGIEPAYGYRFDYRNRSLVLSGDTRPCEELIRQAKGVDVLVHEVVSPEVERRRAQVTDPEAVERIIAHHTTAEQAGRIFARTKPRLAVYSHIVPSPAVAEDLVPPTRRHYSGPLAVGYDLMSIAIGDTIEVHPHKVFGDN